MGIVGDTTWQLDPSVAIMPQITRSLRARVICNDLKPGDRISETEVARSYDVSRQPVREAFIRLADQGLLEIRPQRGTIVTRIHMTTVLDSRFLREAIEADIAKILAEKPDPAVLRELRSQLIEQEEIAADEPSSFMELDDLFHRTLADAAGKSGAWKQIEGLKSQMDRVRFLTLGEFPVKRLVGQHKQIVDEIERGSIAGANAAARTHLREILKDLPRIAERYDAFFDAPQDIVSSSAIAPIQ